MGALTSKWRVSTVVIFAVCVGLAGLMELLKPVPNGCNMTYMYPTYIPIPAANNISTGKYGLYLYHEGWRKIDYDVHLKQLSGVPVLFIPGNGGSYKQAGLLLHHLFLILHKYKLPARESFFSSLRAAF